MPFLKSLKLDGLLSFPPGSEAIPLTALNVLIGPNGSGKSNLIEGIGLLHSLPTSFTGAIRQGGGVSEWLWKGPDAPIAGVIEARIDLNANSGDEVLDEILKIVPSAEGAYPRDLGYGLAFTAVGQRVEITGEIISSSIPVIGNAPDDTIFFYRFQNGSAEVKVENHSEKESLFGAPSKAQSALIPPFVGKRQLDRNEIKVGESVLSHLKDPYAYREITELGKKLGRIQSFREWTIGRDADVRRPQPTDLPNDFLLPDSRNLGLILNQLEHSSYWSEFNSYLSRFLPRFQRFSTRIEGGTVQFYLHEDGLKAPVPATRLSDGTIRFMAILAQLLSPTPPPLICMEEPELGLHPDAIVLLARLLQEASTRTQVIVTTHSEILLSALTEVADSVLVCEYRNGTVLERVESSELRFWLDKYRLGEIWRIGQLGGNV